jgi:hypothetical protein
MVRLINEVLTTAPEFGAHMAATPLGAILDWTMGTPTGFAAFRQGAAGTRPLQARHRQHGGLTNAGGRRRS